MEIVQTPGRVLMLFEFSHFIRQIYTDGRKHNTDLGPTWLGDAIGHWDGDTLVVDTIGFNDKTWLDRAGHPHSTDLHLVERYPASGSRTRCRTTSRSRIPRPIPSHGAEQLTFQLRPTWNLTEMVCEDNVNFDQFLKNEAAPKK